MSVVFILVGCGIVALLLTAWLGTSARRVILIGGFGVTVVAALVAYSLASAPDSVEGAVCHHCAEYFGRWVDPVALIFPAFLVGAWIAGAVVGAAIRVFTRAGSRG